jgi:hypothetical protein
MRIAEILNSGDRDSFCIFGKLDIELMQLAMASLAKLNLLNLKGEKIAPEIRNLFLKYTDALINNIPLREETDHMVRIVFELSGI